MKGLRLGLLARNHNVNDYNNRQNVNLNREPSNRSEMTLCVPGASSCALTGTCTESCALTRTFFWHS